MGINAKVTDIQRSLETLNGILKGIMSDLDVNLAEIQELKFWLDHHKNLNSIYPVFEIFQIIEKAVNDKCLEQSVKAELLEYCSFDSTEGNTLFDKLTQDIRVLHGFLNGIITDKVIKKEELKALRHWLDFHSEHHNKWPFYEITSLVNRILEDEIITPDEAAEFIEYAKEFSEEVIAEGLSDRSIFINQWMMSDSPVFKSINRILDDVDFTIDGHSFCFTGQMRSMKRASAQQLVCDSGGNCHTNVIHSTEYLVIGALSNPAWAYSTYGRKIEKVMNNRQKGINTYLIGEDKFLEQMNA